MLSGKRLLVVEEEVLIAVDIQRILESANADKIVLARNFSEAVAAPDQLDGLDLAIVNPPHRAEHGWMVAQRLLDAGTALIVCSAAPVDLTGTPLAGSQIVQKPFSDGDMLEACRRALAGRSNRACE